MSGVDSGSPVSNGTTSPQSPDPLLDNTPLTLDFDPMSFQFKEFSSPTEEDPMSPIEQERRTPTLTLFDPFATISPDESDIAFEQIILGKEPHHFDPLSNVTPEEPEFPMDPFGIPIDQFDIAADPLIPEHFQNGVNSADDDDTKDALSCAVHETLEPDILVNSAVCNTNNPDLLLIDTQEPQDIVTKDISTSDLVACATPSTNIAEDVPQVLECAVTTITESSVESVFVQDGDSHADDFPVVNVLEHGSVIETVEKDVMLAEEEKCSDSDSESNFHSNTKVSTLKKKTTSVSSESSLSENDSSGKATKTLIMQSTLEKSVKEEVHKDSSSIQMNGVESKRTQYVQQIEQEPSPSPYKEVISTGIDLQILKTSYSQVAAEDTSLSSKESISTGVDIRTLKHSLSHGGEEPSKGKDAETIETGISVNSLKTSFNKTPDEIENFTSAPVEEVKSSVDRAQVTRKFSQRGSEDGKNLCRICNKHVYQMEKITAEKSVFHKDCFKCKECGRRLTVDTYSSHEKEIYCKLHFKSLFQPKCQFGGDDIAPRKQRRNEMVICENTPVELPPDVVRCDTKSNDLDSLSSLNLVNIKSRFESHQDELHLPNTSDLCTLQRSPSLMARMAKYQSAVSGDHTNGDLSGGEEETDRDSSIVRENKHHEKACKDSRQPLVHSETVVLGREVKALSLKEKFEKGSIEKDLDIETEKQEKYRREKEDDLSCLVEPGTAENARNLFKQMDTMVSTGGTGTGSRSPGHLQSPMRSSSTIFQQQGPVVVADIVKCSNPVDKDLIEVETTQISEKFRFFEKYQEPQKERKRFQITPPREAVKEDTPEKELHRDPNIVRCSDAPDDDLPATDTAKKMLNKFKALESQAENPVPVPVSLKPLKRITPPREPEHRAVSPEPERQPDPDIVRCSYKAEEDTSLVEVDKAKSLRAKFENWTSEVVRENLKNEKQLEGSGGEEDYLPQADMTKTLRAMFETIKDTDPFKTSTEKPRPKVSRFIEQQQKMASTDTCAACEKIVYPVEKLEASGMKLHRNCFRCSHCNCLLRFENYTSSGGKLFCVTHFKQLFISKGNYDEGFGREQHKEKWNRSRSSTPTPREECSTSVTSLTEKTSEVAV